MFNKLLVKKQDEFLPELTQDIPSSGIITVGNDHSATIELPDSQIAPEQFVIICEEENTTLLCRVDGTIVNGEALPQGALHYLQTGDKVTVGEYLLIVETADNAESLLKGETIQNLPNLPVEIAAEKENEETEEEKLIKSGKSLNDVLEGLRSEERFYFQIENGTGKKERQYVETEEMWLGWADSGECLITSEADEIKIPRAQIRKDWSGVVLYPLQPQFVWLNNEPLAEPHRLKNDDRFLILAKETAKPDTETVVRFHEPTALLVLDSILPKELPPPILLDKNGKTENFPNGNQNIHQTEGGIHTSRVPQTAALTAKKAQIFGYFTITEILVMAVGTLFTAAIIFLILELY
ncbi:MAG: FHA domain-containing protein [Pyrinomonadaceae bacterium]|nr:FHA domain-containing protein [Pyrinomonadaceae bacterium]